MNFVVKLLPIIVLFKGRGSGNSGVGKIGSISKPDPELNTKQF